MPRHDSVSRITNIAAPDESFEIQQVAWAATGSFAKIQICPEAQPLFPTPHANRNQLVVVGFASDKDNECEGLKVFIGGRLF